MTDYVLEITLESPLTSAAGEGRVGIVDRDIAFDDFGMPVLPGRRLKGLWREAYRDVADAWRQCGRDAISASQVFGSDTNIYIADAELEAASSLKEWLRYLQYPDERTATQKLSVDDVLHYYTTVRRQTAIDRSTGSAKEHTLRFTRTLKPGLVFRARVSFAEPPALEVQNALALGAAALRHMGTSRTRGLGKVRCCLKKLDKNGHLCDLTPGLKQDELPSISRSGATQSTQVSRGKSVPAPCSDLGVPTHVLRYRLKLTAAAVIPVSEGDPNTIVSRQDIPGSHILGAAAWHYLSHATHFATDPKFRHAFLDGGLRFLTAYPEAANTQHRLIPIPHSVRKSKESHALMDFVAYDPENESTTRVDRRYAQMSGGLLETQSVQTVRNYHHARALNDRSKGRALGAEVPEGGAFFTYEAIASGQLFQGAVLGSETDLKHLQTWLPTDTVIRVGRSRSAQYGEMVFEWIDNTPQELSELAEWDGFNGEQSAPSCDASLIITTLSPLLTVNDNGQPDACFPKQELAEVLGLDASTLTLTSSYTRTEVIGGYHSHLKLPRQQMPAIAAGSVFIFKLAEVPDENGLVMLERDGLGLRKGEGYGRVAVNRHSDAQLVEEPLDSPDKTEVPDALGLEFPPALMELLQGVVRTRCIADMQETARTVAGRIEHVPSNSLLGRMRPFLQLDPAIAVQQLERLRKPAKDGLTNARINTSSSGLSWLPNTLYALFEKAWNQPDTLTEAVIQTQVQKILTDDTHSQALIEQLGADDQKTICAVFLNHLLTALYRR